MRPGPLLYAAFFLLVLSIGSIASEKDCKLARPYMVGTILAFSMAAACTKEEDE